MKKLIMGSTLALLASASQASIFNQDVTGIASWDATGDPNNVIVMANLGGGNPATMTGIGWDVILTTIHATSWLSEIRVRFSDSAGGGAVFTLRPGAGVNNPGGPQAFASGGIVDLTDAGLSDLVLPDGILKMQFEESFDDQNDVVDGEWTSGALNIEYTAVPEPASLLVLAGAVGALALSRRRR